MQQALRTLRTPHRPEDPIDGLPMRVAARIGGMLVEAAWHDARAGVEDIESRAIGAVAAALALPRLDRERAGALAEAEGIVCHLTSLVLVDEAGPCAGGAARAAQDPAHAAGRRGDAARRRLPGADDGGGRTAAATLAEERQCPPVRWPRLPAS